MNLDFPITSVSLDGPRRFLLRPKPNFAHESNQKVHEVVLKDGYLLNNGWKMSRGVWEKDGLVGDCISWTITGLFFVISFPVSRNILKLYLHF